MERWLTFFVAVHLFIFRVCGRFEMVNLFEQRVSIFCLIVCMMERWLTFCCGSFIFRVRGRFEMVDLFEQGLLFTTRRLKVSILF